MPLYVNGARCSSVVEHTQTHTHRHTCLNEFAFYNIILKVDNYNNNNNNNNNNNDNNNNNNNNNNNK